MRALGSTCIAAIALAASVGRPTLAATGTWTGASGATWDVTSTNWSGVTGDAWDATNGTANVAEFNTPSTVANVSGTVFANQILFPEAATLQGGTISLGGTSPQISTTGTGTITATLTGSPFRKLGTGTLVLSGTNTLSAGTVTIGNSDGTNANYIRLTSAQALGNVTTISLPNNNAGTSGVQVEGGISTPASLGINSAGRSNQTASGYMLRNNSGDNTWNGPVTITATGGNYGLVSAAGTLTLAGTLTTSLSGQSTRAVHFGGPGNFLVSGPITKTTATDISVTKVDAGTLTLSGTNTYGGGTSITGGRIVADNNAAFGTAGLTINAGAAQVQVVAGRSIGNAITIAGGTGTGTVGEGLLQATGTGTATLGGTITINGAPASGSHFGSVSAATLAIAGAVNSASTAVGVRTGTVVFSGGGSYTALDLGQGTVRVGATNGLSTTAEFRFSNANNNGGNLDLGGFDQTLTGVTKVGVTTGANRVANSSTTTDSTLTLTGTSTFTGIIQDVFGAGTRKVNLVVNGGSFTLTNANTFTGDTRVPSGTLVLGNASAIGGSTLDTQTGTVGTVSFGTLTSTSFGGLKGSTNLVLENTTPAAVTLTVGGNNTSTTYAGGLSGSGSLTKAGTGTLTLSGINTYAGPTSVAAGTLALVGGNNRLPAGTLAFTGSSRLDVGSTSQALTAITTPSGGQFALVMAGAGGSVAVTGSDSMEIGPGGSVSAGQRVTMDMAGLANFSYSSSVGAFRVGLKAGATTPSGVPGTSTVRLADSATITTPLFGIGDTPGSSDGGGAEVSLGQATTINAAAIDQGVFRSNTVLQFAAGLTNPSVTIRGGDGTSPVSLWRVGMVQTNPTFSRTSFTSTADFSGGTLDAAATSLVIGVADSQTAANRGGTETATFTMGAGTLAVGTLTVGQIAGAGSLGGTYAANGTLTIGTAGGLVSATSLRLAENTITATGSVTKTVSGTVNLSAGTLRAASIARGPQTGSATTATTAFNWTGGTLGNKAGGDLTIDTVPLTLASGTGTFDATGSNSITVGASSPISGSGGLAKTGPGRLVLSGTNTYGGPTAVNAGTLLVNGNQSAAAGAVSVATAATLGGTGTIGGATTINGTHSPGASPGLQTFTNGLAYSSTGTLVWELSANTDLSADRGILYDGIDLTTAGSLAIDPAATVSLVFNAPLVDATPSTVAWSNSFWDFSHQWTIASVAVPVTWNGSLFGTLAVGVDSTGASLATARPGASFNVTNDSGNVVLNYVAVPEPTTLALALAGLAAAAGGIRRLDHRRVQRI